MPHFDWVDKVNTTLKQKKLKDALEVIGHTNVEVWWEPLRPATEMCGMGGGYLFHSDQEDMGWLGYSFSQAIEMIKNEPWLRVKAG
jgi:hypothetical protein